ncbi:hypothetical protein [Candidatus Harpocratesius sp.]
MTLLIGYHHVALRESKIPFKVQIADWLLDLGLNIKVCVVDREYYRYYVLKSFKQRNIEVITPAKNYHQIKNCKKEILNANRGRIQQYSLGSKTKKKQRRKIMRC